MSDVGLWSEKLLLVTCYFKATHQRLAKLQSTPYAFIHHIIMDLTFKRCSILHKLQMFPAIKLHDSIRRLTGTTSLSEPCRKCWRLGRTRMLPGTWSFSSVTEWALLRSPPEGSTVDSWRDNRARSTSWPSISFRTTLCRRLELNDSLYSKKMNIVSAAWTPIDVSTQCHNDLSSLHVFSYNPEAFMYPLAYYKLTTQHFSY